mgnify:CR=1 FL=1
MPEYGTPNDAIARDIFQSLFPGYRIRGVHIPNICLGGGGIQGGRAIGKSDKWAMDPAENPYGPEDLCATVFHLMGIPPHKEMITPEGRPVMLTNSGRVIRELI